MRTKDIWTTKDGYHVQDVLELKRCIICGRMAQPTQSVFGYACCQKDRQQLLACLKEISLKT